MSGPRVARCPSLRAVGAALALILGAVRGEAQQSAQAARLIHWSERDWAVKGEPVAVGPGPNLFSGGSRDVRVDRRGRLHLRIVRRHRRWWSTEITSLESLGYGTYRFDIAAGATTIPGNAVLGLFTYDMAPEQEHREIDIELSHWGEGRRENDQCAIQPATSDDLRFRFPVQENRGGWSMKFTWAPGSVDCSVVALPSDRGALPRAVASHRLTRAVPQPGAEKVHLNLWLYHGSTPDTGRGAEVILRSFRFTPLPR